MIAYGSYVKKETNLVKSVNQIEIFDTAVALLAGLLIIPAVYTFMGTEGMSAGPSLMFVALPKVFDAMGGVGVFIGILFFLMVAFAAVTSSVSVMEAVVAGVMDKFRIKRGKAVLIVGTITLFAGIVVCLGYNLFYFKLHLPNMAAGKTGQILDVMDYVSNNLLMPVVAIGTCILIGYVVKPKSVFEEVEKSGCTFSRKKLYVVMIKVVAPVLLTILLLQALGLIKF
jgi:NSS family neurotransmitter:Na+ symporter